VGDEDNRASLLGGRNSFSLDAVEEHVSLVGEAGDGSAEGDISVPAVRPEGGLDIELEQLGGQEVA
jgi:hypothetical protein